MNSRRAPRELFRTTIRPSATIGMPPGPGKAPITAPASTIVTPSATPPDRRRRREKPGASPGAARRARSEGVVVVMATWKTSLSGRIRHPGPI
jgi:hypothetical protein